MTTLTDTFSRNLRSARALRGMTQTALARAAGLAAGYVSMLENAQRDPPLSTVAQLAAALNMPPVALLTESERTRPGTSALDMLIRERGTGEDATPLGRAARAELNALLTESEAPHA